MTEKTLKLNNIRLNKKEFYKNFSILFYKNQLTYCQLT